MAPILAFSPRIAGRSHAEDGGGSEPPPSAADEGDEALGDTDLNPNRRYRFARTWGAISALLFVLASCATPPVYEKPGATASDFYASKNLCLERSQRVQLIADCEGAFGTTCRVRIDWEAFDACMEELGWQRVGR